MSFERPIPVASEMRACEEKIYCAAIDAVNLAEVLGDNEAIVIARKFLAALEVWRERAATARGGR